VRKWLTLLVVTAVVGTSGTVFWQHRQAEQRRRDRAASLSVATRFLKAWQGKQYDVMGALTAGDPDAGQSYARLAQRLKATSVVPRPGAFSPDGRHLAYDVTAQLTGLGVLTWTNSVATEKTGRGWRVAFTSASVFPGLRNGQVLTRSDPLVSRGELTDRHGQPLRSASADLAANVLGSAGSTKTGLERIYDLHLTGTSGGDVEVVDRATGQVTQLVKHFPARAASAVRTTLDLSVQRAAEAALAGVPGQSALVAIDAATGEVRAIANSPIVGLPPALRSEAPGSTFKVVVAEAALEHGLTPASTVACPAQVVFGGKAFKNDELLPASMTFATAFARSCNTAFLKIADGFPKGTVGRTAKLFGFGRGNLLPIGGEGGDVPAPGSTSEAYADIIGQGRVEASPLLLASMSAAVESGVWRQPHLLSGSGPSNPVPMAAALRTLMRGVVTGGTAATAGLPAGTAGKTGTAQYGTGSPLRTHAWFTGFRNGLAFCVYVKDGASGGSVAAPVAARFLRALSG
jgi:cell division protein FtsI/penicillin-binding protein 2